MEKQAVSAWARVQKARESSRVKAMDLASYVFDDFIEMHGDRLYADDAAIISGIAYLKDMPVTIVAEQKGKNTRENLDRNFAMPHPEGYRKAMRAMQQAEKFKRPIITIVDTPGAYCGIGAEERGQGESIGRSLMLMSSLKVPIISLVLSEGGSGGALAISVADEIWMFENAIYSILSPEGFASILWKDSTRAKEASEIMKLTATDLKNLGIIEKIIKENEDIESTFKTLKTSLYKRLNELSEIKPCELLSLRYNKFRSIGEYEK